MGAETLSSRAVIGRFYKELEQNVGASWIGALANKFQSNQDSETYPWIGQVPAMREWIGGRQAKGFTQNGITISNKHWESTLSVSATDLRRDKTGQLDVRIRELATKANAHWASLLSTLIINGESTACYDGQYFFDTDHSEADSGTQSNDISVDISALATAANDWQSERQKRDPNFAAKLVPIQKELAYLKTTGQLAATPEGIRQQLEAVYKTVNAGFKKPEVKPAPKVQARTPQTNGSVATVVAHDSTTMDAAQRVLARRGAAATH